MGPKRLVTVDITGKGPMRSPDRINEDERTAVSATASFLALTLLCVISHQALAAVVCATVVGTAALFVLVGSYFGLRCGKRLWQPSVRFSPRDEVSSSDYRPLSGLLTPSPQAFVSQTAGSAFARIPNSPEIHRARHAFASSPARSSVSLHSELSYKP
jgi:hypothetical protein